MNYQVVDEDRPRIIKEVSRCILQYLHAHPEARDTVEGVATWWIAQQRLIEGVSMVQEALCWLEHEGRVATYREPGGRLLYSLKDE